MGIERLLKKFDKVKKAVNSIKGIQSKIQSISSTPTVTSSSSVSASGGSGGGGGY